MTEFLMSENATVIFNYGNDLKPVTTLKCGIGEQ